MIGWNSEAWYSTRARITEGSICGWSASRKMAAPAGLQPKVDIASIPVRIELAWPVCQSSFRLIVIFRSFTAPSTNSASAPVTTIICERPASSAVCATARTNGWPCQSRSCLGWRVEPPAAKIIPTTGS